MKTQGFRRYINVSTIAAAAGTVWASIMSFQYLFICKLSVPNATAEYIIKNLYKLRPITLHGSYRNTNAVVANLDLMIRVPGTLLVRMEVSQEAKHDPRVTTLTFLRWDMRHVLAYLDTVEQERMTGEEVAVEMVSDNNTMGTLIGTVGKPHQPYLAAQDYAAIEADVARCALGLRPKVGLIIWGEPGNGKTSLIRYLSDKYKMPLRFLVFSEYLDNEDLTYIFSKLPPRCILVMEDFDKILDEDGNIDSARAGCSLDGLLNGMDGVYNNYKGVVFVLTCRDIEVLDPAIRCRPSRFKHKLEIKNPGREMRSMILGSDPEVLDRTEGWSLDQVLMELEDRLDG